MSLSFVRRATVWVLAVLPLLVLLADAALAQGRGGVNTP